MTKNFDKRNIDKGFHTGYEVDYVTIPEHDYEYLKYKARLADDYETINKELHQRGRKVRKQNKRYREAIKEAIQFVAPGSVIYNTLNKALEDEK